MSEETCKPFMPALLPLSENIFDWSALIEELGAANRALARYAGMLASSENLNLLLSPFVREEIVRSNRIEGTRADTISVLRADAGVSVRDGSERDDLQEIFNYREALESAKEEMLRRPFSLDFLCGLHRILLQSVRGDDKSPGKFREVQNYIGSEFGGIESATFVPPDPLSVPALMDNWIAYFFSSEKDPIVQAAILHAQFEMIHPFCDGNGRLGRMLLPLFFFQKGILPAPVFYMSRRLERFETEYRSALHDISAKSAWMPWILFFVRVVRGQAEENLKILEQIRAFYRESKALIAAKMRSRHALPLFDAIVAQPIFRIASLKFASAPSRLSVANSVSEFEKLGLIRRIEDASGRRGALFVCPKLMNIAEQKEIF